MSTDTRGRKALPPPVWMLVVGSMVLLARPAAAGFDAGAAFNARCSSCHSVGQGVVVGPDLRGVTERHDAGWLHRFIRSSQSVIRSGDRAAMALFATYKKRMPDHPFTDAEVDALLAFIEAGGPKADPGEYRLAGEATAAEVARGHDLFSGTVALANGGAACIHCHDAGGAGWQSGALASDLTAVYVRYRDGGLTRALTESRFPLMADYRERPLTRDEVFALKAFLYQASRAHPVGRLASGSPLFAPLAWLSELTQWFSGRSIVASSE